MTIFRDTIALGKHGKAPEGIDRDMQWHYYPTSSPSHFPFPVGECQATVYVETRQILGIVC